MNHVKINASVEQKQALVDALREAGLADKGATVKDRQSQSFRFENGDVVTIEAGYAVPLTATINGTENNYLGFHASVRHANGATEQTTISLRQLTTPTILVDKPSDQSTFALSQFAYRFGRHTVAFEDATTEGDNVVLIKLERPVTFKISLADEAWEPDFDTYDASTRKYMLRSEPRRNYGYVKA